MIVNTVTPEPLHIITKLSGHYPVVDDVDQFENGYPEVHVYVLVHAVYTCVSTSIFLN